MIHGVNPNCPFRQMINLLKTQNTEKSNIIFNFDNGKRQVLGANLPSHLPKEYPSLSLFPSDSTGVAWLVSGYMV